MIQSRRFSDQEFGGTERTVCENLARKRIVRQRDHFVGAGEDHVMLTDDRAAADAGYAKLVCASRGAPPGAVIYVF